MRWLLAVLMLSLMSHVHAAEDAAALGGGNTPSILVFGDSLSAAYGMPVEAGWVSLLQQRLASQGYPHRVFNASVSGETTRGGLDRLPDALARFNPSLVILELGANDGLQGKPVEDLGKRLEQLIETTRRHGATPLLVRMRLPPNYGPSYIEKFVATFEQTARKMDVPLSDFMLEGVAGDPVLTQDDGLHPTAAGQPRILENLWPSIEPLLASNRPVQSAGGAAGGTATP